jgi:hypothetical protein
MFELSANTNTPLLGRDASGNWLAVPGPGDGPGPAGWLPVSAVSIEGDLSTVEILPAPPLPNPTETPLPGELPLHLDPGSPPTNACTASVPGGGHLLVVYLGPGEHFAPVALLGNWSEVISSTTGWSQVLLGPGQSGWVATSRLSCPVLARLKPAHALLAPAR